jgi:hypothetical protein
MPTIKDFLGFIVNPPPGDPTLTAGSDEVGKSVVTVAGAAGGTIPAADGLGSYTWIASSGPGPPGPVGPAGPAGPGIPTGGPPGYLLAKNTAANYDTVWQPPGDGPAGPPGQGVPPGGATGQALIKSANNDYATTWTGPGGDLAGTYAAPTVPTVRGGLVPVARTDAAGGDLTGTYPNPRVSIATVTALPASPFDGQEIYFIADDANGVIWHLRYRATSGSTSKWEFVGGPPMTATVDSDDTFAEGATYVNPAPNVGPTIVVPLTGNYALTMTANFYIASQTAAGNANLALSIGGAVPVAPNNAAGYISAGSAVTVTKNGTAATTSGNGFRLQYNVPVAIGGTAHVRWRALQIVPVNVGP